MAKKNSVVSVVVEDNQIRFVVEGQKSPINLDPSKLTDDIRTRAMIHGLVQKVSDAAALGKDATPADKFAAMQAVVDRLNDGEWNKRSGEGGDSSPAGIIRRAFIQWATDNGKSPESAATKYESMTRKEQLALRKIPAIAEILEAIKASRGPVKSVDTDALLAELG